MHITLRQPALYKGQGPVTNAFRSEHPASSYGKPRFQGSSQSDKSENMPKWFKQAVMPVAIAAAGTLLAVFGFNQARVSSPFNINNTFPTSSVRQEVPVSNPADSPFAIIYPEGHSETTVAPVAPMPEVQPTVANLLSQTESTGTLSSDISQPQPELQPPASTLNQTTQQDTSTNNFGMTHSIEGALNLSAQPAVQATAAPVAAQASESTLTETDLADVNELLNFMRGIETSTPGLIPEFPKTNYCPNQCHGNP